MKVLMKYHYKFRKRVYETGQTIVAITLLLPTLIALFFFFIYPVIHIFYLSFTSTNTITGISKFIGLDNFYFLFKNEIFRKAVLNTFVFTLVKLTMEVVISLLLAVMLDMVIPFRKLLRICYFAPVIVPVVASSIIFMWLYDPQLGPINQILKMFHLQPSYFIYDAKTALISIIIFAVWRAIGYDIIIFISGLQGINQNSIEAAKIDGATEFQILTRIKLPLLKPVISFVIMMGAIGCFQAFTEVDIMTDGGPNNSTILMVNYIYKQAFGNSKMGRGAAASIILFLIILTITIMQKALSSKRDRYDER